MVGAELPEAVHDSICSVVTAVVEENLARLLALLVAADSRTPPGDCRAVVAACSDWLDEVGLAYRVVAADESLPNLVVEVGGRSEDATLCWNAHIDTVTPGDLGAWKTDPFTATEVNGMVYGLGAGNCKAGAAVQLCAALALQRSGLDLGQGLVVTLVSDEENLGPLGTAHLVEEGFINPRYFVGGEATRNAVVVAQRGLLWARVDVVGTASHGAIPQRGRNAISDAVRMIVALEDAFSERLPGRKAPGVPASSANVGTIVGGESTNMVAPTCSFTVDRRLVPGETPSSALAELREICEAVARERGAAVAVESLREVEPYATSPDSALATSFTAAGRSAGCDVRLGESMVLSDARFLAGGDTEFVVFGPGDIFATHGPNEGVPVDEMVCATHILAQSAAQLLAGPRPGAVTEPGVTSDEARPTRGVK
jgi:acetylornithine deacetylase/succinyl-diaminopimelate desuccinylase